MQPALVQMLPASYCHSPQAAQSGDVQAVKELRNLIGEDRAQAPEAESRIDEYLSALEDTVKNEPKSSIS